MGNLADRLTSTAEAVETLELNYTQLQDQHADLKRDIDSREDEAEARVRDSLAAELEPIFAAIFRGDMVDVQRRVAFLPAMLDGNDPVLLALQRAKAHPTLYAA